ncbi:MAG: prolyl-tRNA synthetase associated domain-containing protein [Lentimicrobiaceae bacterium]|nr:prolyl-tRNA synthetase associated domain-containing protein [Lentimicrobiaceae bacterium]MCO5265053.1 prolyl-tRNA synthetase associated domain-containing protein [Lentimicrobium sp.]
MNGDPLLYRKLDELKISFEYYEHPPAPTIEIALQFWKDIKETTHCKNLFFRNHKGNKHYLVIFSHLQTLAIHDLEKRLKQGKLSFASEQRMEKYLGLKPGSVSPFGLIHDIDHHVHLFLDKNLKNLPKISFHPNINTASLVLNFNDFMKYLESTGNTWEFLELYD